MRPSQRTTELRDKERFQATLLVPLDPAMPKCTTGTLVTCATHFCTGQFKLGFPPCALKVLTDSNRARSRKKMLRCPGEVRASDLMHRVRRGDRGKRKAKSHRKLRPHTGSDSCPWWPAQLTQGLPALHSLAASVLHTASSLFQRGTGGTPVPWLLQDMPLADTVGDLTGLDTATPGTPLCHNTGDRWKRRQHLQGQLWHL